MNNRHTETEQAAARTTEAEGMYIATVTPSEGDPAAVAAPTLSELHALILEVIREREGEFSGSTAQFIHAHPVPDDPAQAEEWLAGLNAWSRPPVVTVYDPYQVRTTHE